MNEIKEIDVHTLKSSIDKNNDLLLIDVREQFEVDICKLNNSLHIPMNQVPNQIDKISKNKNIVVICKSGVRSYQVCQYLSHIGYKKITNLKGGIISWALEIDDTLELY